MKHPLQQLMVTLLVLVSKLLLGAFLLFLCVASMLGCTDPDIAGHRWICFQDSDCGAGWICLEGVCEPEGSIPTNPDDNDSNGSETDGTMETEFNIDEAEDDTEEMDVPPDDNDSEDDVEDPEPDPAEVEPDVGRWLLRACCLHESKQENRDDTVHFWPPYENGFSPEPFRPKMIFVAKKSDRVGKNSGGGGNVTPIVYELP